ncbi:MAG: cold shock domain-containing protein [Phycisphaerales bacterium]
MSGTEGTITNETGQVKWFDPRKGYGFIVGPDGQDIFVHYTVIEADGFRALKDGSTVNYDAKQGDKGWSATRAVRVDDAESTDADDDSPENNDNDLSNSRAMAS